MQQDTASEFRSTMSSLLNQRLPKPEVQSLKDEGFILKKPTRKTAVMIALYKKAITGDLSAIKEIDSIISDSKSDGYKGTVTIIDDIRLQNL